MKSVTPAVAVVIPTLNSVRYLAEAIRSIRDEVGCQNIWCLDGQSVDGGEEIARVLLGSKQLVVSYGGLTHPCDRIDAWLDAHHEEYDYLAIQHSDDIACPDRIANQLEAFRLEPELACVSGGFAPFWTDIGTMQFGRDPLEFPACLHDEIVARLPVHWVMPAPTLMFDIRKLRSSGVKFRNRFDFCGDWWMSVEMVRAGLRLGNCPKILQAYRRHSQSDGPRNLSAVNREQAEIRELLKHGI